MLLEGLCHWHLGFILFTMGEYASARVHLQKVISSYDPQKQHHAFVYLRGSDPGVSAFAYDACCLWCLGYPEQALKRSQKAISLAQELAHAFSLADALCFGGCVFNQMRRDTQALQEVARELKCVSEETSFISFAGTGTCYSGEALVELGEVEEGVEQIHRGLEIRKSVGARCHQTGMLGALADAQVKAKRPEEGLATLAEALAWVEESDERYYEAELYRLQGALMLMQGNRTQAETCFQNSLEVARRQQAKSWELRTATSLARLWEAGGKKKKARELLGGIYGWFTEGFDTPDLQEAKALLKKVS
jgi:adenylate cyclase